MVDADPAVGTTSPAPLAVSLQNVIPDPAKVTKRMAPLPVTGLAEAGGEGWEGATRAKERELARIPFPVPANAVTGGWFVATILEILAKLYRKSE